MTSLSGSGDIWRQAKGESEALFMIELMRSAALTSFPELARSLGLNPDALIAAAGIDRRALADPDMRIPVESAAELLEMAAQQSGVEAFGLRLAETRQLSIIGRIGLLLREEATVGDAFRSVHRYIALHNEAVTFRLEKVEDQAVISGGLHLARRKPYRQGTELTLAVLYRVLGQLIGPQWRPLVCIAHDPPARRDVHQRVLGPRVDFRCNYNGLIFPWSDLDRPVHGADPAFAHQIRAYLESLRGRTGPTLREKVGGLLRLQLSSGRCTSDRLARQLGCDRRTLHRRLVVENTTFDAILNDVRVDAAVRLMQNRQTGLAEAAAMLGFSSGSAFSRWFLAAFGKRPPEWRKITGTTSDA